MFQIYAGDVLVYEPGDYNLALLTPKLTIEMGKAGSLEFTVPASHPNMDLLKQLTKPVSVDLDGEKIFRGRILSETRTFYNQREIYCEGDLSYLVDSVQKAVKYTGKTHALFNQIIANHNARMPAEKQFTVGNITVENRDIILTGQSDDISQYDYKQIAINSIVDNWNTTYDYIETCLISYCGGYLVTRQVNGVNYIDWINDYTNTASQEIVFGENLLDLTDESSAEDIFTVLIPLGDDNLTVKTVNNNSDEIVDATKVAKYGRIIKTNVFSNVTNPQTLLENGRRYLANNGDVPTTLTLTAVDLHSVYPEITAIHLGDRVFIRSDPHELSQYLTCTKIEYDLEKPENTVYTFGREKQSLTQRYREDKRAQNDTYSNSADGGYGIGSGYGGYGAIDEGVQEAETKTDTKLTNFYDEWIDYDPDHPDGKISLGALAKLYIGQDGNGGDRYKLINNVGIDLDAPSGQISLYTTAQKANTNESAVARITTWAGTDEHGNLGSNIALEADLVRVSNRLEAIEGVFSSITASTASISRDVSTSSYYGNHYFINATQGDSVDLSIHYHTIYTDSQGKLYLGAPVGSQEHTDISAVVTPVFGA